MDYMVNMMREHLPQETRIHYIITRGGAAPNIVPDFAEAYYYARHPNMPILDGIWERMVSAAKGAALGTGTTMDLDVTGAVYNMLPNTYLSGVMNDLSDVSWNVPTVSMTGATFVPGVPAHSWQATACAGGTIGVKGMMVAAKTMALTTVDLFTEQRFSAFSAVSFYSWRRVTALSFAPDL